MWQFDTVTDAFEFYYDRLDSQLPGDDGTKALYNQIFTIVDTSEKIVSTPYRNFKQDYAELEWNWYLSKNRSAVEIAKVAKIWYNHMDERGYVHGHDGIFGACPCAVVMGGEFIVGSAISVGAFIAAL